MGHSTQHHSVVIQCGNIPLPFCLRGCALSALFFLALCACCVQIFRIIRNTRRYLSYQLIILYMASLECTIAVIHWMFAPFIELEFVLLFLRTLQLFFITYYFMSMSLILFGKPEYVKKILWPVFGVLFVLFCSIFAIAVSGLTRPSSLNDECGDPSFIMISATGFIVASIFLIFCLFVQYKANKTSGISKNIKKQKAREYWILVIVNFLTALIDFSWDVIVLIIDLSVGRCYQFDSDWLHSIVSFTERFVDILVPIIAVIFVFNNEASRTEGKKLLLQHDDETMPLASFGEDEDGIYSPIRTSGVYEAGSEYESGFYAE